LRAYVESRILSEERRLGRPLELGEKVAVMLDEKFDDVREWLRTNPDGVVALLRFRGVYSRELGDAIAARSAGSVGSRNAMPQSAEAAKPVVTLDGATGAMRIAAGGAIGAEDTGADFIMSRMKDFGEVMKAEVLHDQHGGKECHIVAIGAVPTKSDGNEVAIEGLASPITGVKSAMNRLIEREKIGNINLVCSIGRTGAVSAMMDIHNAAAAGVTPDRLHCSISKKMLDALDKDPGLLKALGVESVRKFLETHTMLEVVHDEVQEDGRSLVLPMPYGRVMFMGLARINLVNMIPYGLKEGGEGYEDYLKALSLYARAVSLVTNSSASEIENALMAQAAKDPKQFFLKKTFEVMLPPIAKIDVDLIRRSYEAEREALRSL
jgi:hypothetical protein